MMIDGEFRFNDNDGISDDADDVTTTPVTMLAMATRVS